MRNPKIIPNATLYSLDRPNTVIGIMKQKYSPKLERIHSPEILKDYYSLFSPEEEEKGDTIPPIRPGSSPPKRPSSILRNPRPHSSIGTRPPSSMKSSLKSPNRSKSSMSKRSVTFSDEIQENDGNVVKINLDGTPRRRIDWGDVLYFLFSILIFLV